MGIKGPSGTRANKMEEDAGVEKFGLLKLVKSSTAQSGWSGVRPGPKNKQGEFKWQAYLTVGGKKRGLKGLYEDPRDAAIQLAVKKQNLELTPDGAWSDEESDDAPSKPRAPRGALCLLVPFAFRVFTYTYIGSCELRLAFSLAGSKVKEAAAPLSALSTNTLTRSRHPRALPAASTSLASPAVPAALCLATPPRSSQLRFAWHRQCPCAKATREPIQHALGRVCRRARRWRGIPARLTGARFAICDCWG